MTNLDRTEQLHLRVSEEEIAMLRAVAADRGLTLSDVVRTMVREAYRARFGEASPKKPRRTTK